MVRCLLLLRKEDYKKYIGMSISNYQADVFFDKRRYVRWQDIKKER